MKKIINKLLALNLQKIIKYIKPLKINEQFYIASKNNSNNNNNLNVNFPYTIEHYTHKDISTYEHINKRLSKFSQVYLIIENQVIIHETWVFLDAYLPSRFGYKKNMPLIGSCVTNNRYRGKNIYPNVLKYALYDLLQIQQYKEVYITTSHNNIASIKGIEKTDFKLDAYVQAARMFGLLFYKTKT